MARSTGAETRFCAFRLPVDDLEWMDEQADQLRTNRSHFFRLLVAHARRQGVTFSVNSTPARRSRALAA